MVHVGCPVGSTLIDMEFHKLISARLDNIKDQLLEEPEDVAEQILQGKFEGIKCSFGMSGASSMATIPLSVPGLAPGLNFPIANIENSRIKFTGFVIHVPLRCICTNSC